MPIASSCKQLFSCRICMSNLVKVLPRQKTQLSPQQYPKSRNRVSQAHKHQKFPSYHCCSHDQKKVAGCVECLRQASDDRYLLHGRTVVRRVKPRKSFFSHTTSWDKYRRDGVVVRASASQSVDLGFISQVESYQKT